jgi:hypothetical protein
VGGAIRRVLTEHGLGTDTRLPGEGTEQDQGDADNVITSAEAVEVESLENGPEEQGSIAVLEEKSASVIDLTEPSDVGGVGDTTVEEGTYSDEESEVEAVAAVVTEPEPPEAGSEEVVASEIPVIETAETTAPVAPPAPERAASMSQRGFARIESVAVEEGRDGILVTVASSDGEEVRQVASSTEGGVEAAVVKATARLALPEAPEPVIVDIEERRIQGVDIVMIVLDADGSMAAGSSVVAAGRSFALGRATWAALSL